MIRVFAQDDRTCFRSDWETMTAWPAWLARPGRVRLHCHEEHDHEWNAQWAGIYAMARPYVSEVERIEKESRTRRALLKDIADNLAMLAEGAGDGTPDSWLPDAEIPF